MSEDEIKLPYVVQPKRIPDWFNKLKEVETPPKFTLKFLEDVMLFKSNNDRNLISLLKGLDFLDEKGAPTQWYKDYKITDMSEKTLAKGVRHAYNEIYRRNVNFHNLDEEQIKGYVKAITGLGEKSSIVPLIVKTLRSLIDIADFSEEESTASEPLPEEEKEPSEKSSKGDQLKLNYTISINLPSSGTQETYDRIFESIKKILLSK